MMVLTTAQYRRYLAWACMKLEIEHPPHDARWIAGEINGSIVFVLVYTHFTERDCMMTIATDRSKRWATRRALQLIFGTPFNFWKLRRLTCLVNERNAESIEVVTRLNFCPEGRLSKFFDEKSDGLLFGLLREDCPWI